MTLSGGPSPSRWGVSAVAGLGVDEDMKAEGPARRGRSAVDGLAVEEALLADRVANHAVTVERTSQCERCC